MAKAHRIAEEYRKVPIRGIELAVGIDCYSELVVLDNTIVAAAEGRDVEPVEEVHWPGATLVATVYCNRNDAAGETVGTEKSASHRRNPSCLHLSFQ
jgi:hypothetical protein